MNVALMHPDNGVFVIGGGYMSEFVPGISPNIAIIMHLFLVSKD